MCTLKSNQTSQSGQSRMPKQEGVRNVSVQTATAAVSSCSSCKTLHYVHQLTCRTCGHYLDAQPQGVGAARQSSKVGLMAVAAIALVAMAGACMFHII